MTVVLFSSLFSVNTSGRALGCCAGLLCRRAGGLRGMYMLSRHMPQSRCFTCVWRFFVMRLFFSPLHDRLVLYLARHVSVHHSMMFLVGPLMSNSTLVGPSRMFIVLLPRSSFELLEQFVY